MLVAYEAGPATDVAGVITHLAGAIGSGVGGPTAGTTVSRCAQMLVVDDVPLAPPTPSRRAATNHRNWKSLLPARTSRCTAEAPAGPRRPGGRGEPGTGGRTRPALHDCTAACRRPVAI
jgi:hypothetical protein